MQTIDFSRSFVRWTLDREQQDPITISHPMPVSRNKVRINLECRCQLTDRASNRTQVYVLGASCKSERVGVDRDIWLEPNSDYCLIMSDEEFMVMKSWAHTGIRIMRYPESLGSQPERQSGANYEAWTECSVDIKTAAGRALTSRESIYDAISGDRPLVARSEYQDGDYSIVLEYPVKTMNFSEREHAFQTDTGPVLLPDLTAARLNRCARIVECFDLAYAAFNSANWAEFVINIPTDVGHGIKVNHYAKPRRIESMQNQLFELVDEAAHRLRQKAGDRNAHADLIS